MQTMADPCTELSHILLLNASRFMEPAHRVVGRPSSPCTDTQAGCYRRLVTPNDWLVPVPMVLTRRRGSNRLPDCIDLGDALGLLLPAMRTQFFMRGNASVLGVLPLATSINIYGGMAG